MRTHCDSISARQSLGKRRYLTKVRQTKNQMQNTFRSWHIFLIMGLMALFIIVVDRQEKYRDEIEFIENRAAAGEAKICRECSK